MINKSNEQREEINENIVAGRNPVFEVLRHNRTIDKILIAQGNKEGSILKIISVAKERGIPVIDADKNKLDNLSGNSNHQGVVAFVTPFNYCEIDDILNAAKEKNEPPLIFICDGITDPGNLGALIRTANAAGAHGIILPKRNTCSMTTSVFKASAGAFEYVKIARVVNITITIKELQAKNIWIYGADGSAHKNIYETDLKGPAAVVLGDEGKGLSRLVRETCDFLIKIPMKGEISSLNVSVAGAVIIYEILRQRG